MTDSAAPIQAAIAALQAQRDVLGAAVVDAALAPLRKELDKLRNAADAAPAQQLRWVTVLFCDVVGSTAMGEQLAPEDIHAVMDSALARFTSAVRAHAGRVLQYTGDGMLAAFGTETAREDEAEQAVLAGLAVIEAARAHAPLVQRDHGVPDFNVRVGIHSGRVLLGGGVDAEGSIRGATVNVAARMEQSAPPGRLRISHDTWCQVRGLFDATEQAPIVVKGVSGALRSHLVERARPRAFRAPTRGIQGVDTRMVGRDAELRALQSAFKAVCTRRTLQAVTVVGEAGLGKSRLLSEFQRALDPSRQPCWLLLSRSHPRSALHAHGQLRGMLASQLHIADSDSADVARAKLLAGLAPLLAGADEAGLHALGHLIGMDFSSSPHLKDMLQDDALLRARAFDTASRCLRGLSAVNGAPVVLVFDDLHWADDGSVAFVRHLFNSNRDMPLLCLLLARPGLFERWPQWPGSPESADSFGTLPTWHRRIDIRPLDAAGSNELSAVLLQRLASVPDALRHIVTGRAEGNPFYMEELVKMLIDSGVIVTDGPAWHMLPDRLSHAQLPATLAGVLQARLDALRPRERTVLQQAAVVGHVFWDQALAAIDPAALQVLPALLAQQLVVRRDAEAAGDYAFHHQLLHQVTYDSVLKEPRRQGHDKVGAFWSKRAEVNTPQHVNPAACRALMEAHEHRRLADPVALARWFDAQFFNYLHAFAGQVLRPLSQAMVELCERHHGADHLETARALTNLARVAVQRRELQTAEPALRRALAIQERAHGSDHADTARTLAVLGGVFQARGDYAAAEPLFRRALHARERLLGPDDPLTLGTLHNLAHLVTELGQMDEAEALSRRVLQAREQALGPDTPETASALMALGEVLVKKGDAAQGEALLRRALAVQQQHLPADHPDLGLTMWHLVEALRALSRHDEAEPLARGALRLWEDTMGPDHEWTAWGLGSLAEVRLAQQAADEAVTLAARALAIHQRNFGAQHAQVVATLLLLDRARGTAAGTAQCSA